MNADPSELRTEVLSRDPLRIPDVTLVVVDGPDRGARCTLAHGSARIGTSVGNEVRLTDPTVSRMHCEVTARAGVIRIRDLGSTNGTFVSGVRIHDAELTPSALVRLGVTTLRADVGELPLSLEVSAASHFGDLVGQSVEMRRIYSILERVAPTDATVLVRGETGTGKEVVAKSLHVASRRKDKAFVPVDCSAIPENLFESELFGHMRGSFTGASSDRKGVFEEAAGGTLFLDEIGELPLHVQPKLLRALETRTIRRVGANKPTSFDVRVVAATNRSLAECVNQGTFREDLYYRLAVVEVELPPLRSRRDDIPLLSGLFYQRFTNTTAPVPPGLLSTLMTRGWPGNVRELRNFMERAVSLGLAEGLATTAAPPTSRPDLATSLEALVPLDLPLKEARTDWIQQFETIYASAMLKRTGGNVTRAAERAGVSRRFLQRLLARVGRDVEADDE